MRFYLDSARPEDIREAAAWPWVAGITTNPAILDRAGLTRVEPVLEAVTATGRKDWSVWVQLPLAGPDATVREALALQERLETLTGGRFAGPTLVVKLLPAVDHLWAAARLVARGVEVCITGVADAFQAIAVSRLPRLDPEREPPHTEGPPGSRNPGQPDSVAVYVGRIGDAGEDGARALTHIATGLHKSGRRTRVLAASLRDWEMVAQSLRAAEYGTLDLTLGVDMLREILDNPVTADATAQFAAIEARFAGAADDEE